jgi:hypothetical protein
MDRCRIDATPRPDDTSPPSIANITGTSSISCIGTFTADVADSQSGVSSVSITISGAGAGLPATFGMTAISATTYQASVTLPLAAGETITAATVSASDGAGNSASATKTGGTISNVSGSCFGTLFVIGDGDNPIRGFDLSRPLFWIAFVFVTAAGVLVIGRLRRPKVPSAAAAEAGMPAHAATGPVHLSGPPGP